ncbi:MAG: hypothetical protein JNL70_24040 [Saprospiraceae bacterium]|nr:hypothetical protein [Saprospiraceae bacterium]
MKNNITLTIAYGFILFLISCQKSQDINLPILEDRTFSIESFTCTDSNRFFDWQCSFNQNYIQKDISSPDKRNFTFKFSSDNFNKDSYGFRVQIFVNNIIRFRRSTREFPFETPLFIPEGSIISVKTFVEKYNSANEDISGQVNCKIIGEMQ